MMNGKKHRILIVDDHPLVRDGLKLHLDSQQDMEVCGEAGDVLEALNLVKSSHPDLIIVDLSLKTGHGLELIKEIRSREPRARILVISAHQESMFAERSLRAGAMGFLNKQQLQSQVVVAIRSVLEGRRYLSEEMTQQLLGQAVGETGDGASRGIDSLSDRELEVFQLIGRGKTTREIAQQLHLSVHTIDSHREKIRHKLKLDNSVALMRQAVQWVLENG